MIQIIFQRDLYNLNNLCDFEDQHNPRSSRKYNHFGCQWNYRERTFSRGDFINFYCSDFFLEKVRILLNILIPFY